MITPLMSRTLSREESSRLPTGLRDPLVIRRWLVEIPTGAPPIFPAGAHQVSNVGETDVKIVFVEVSGKFGDTPDHLKSPCDTDPDCYKVLAENDE
jgi:hypothetical protein